MFISLLYVPLCRLPAHPRWLVSLLLMLIASAAASGPTRAAQAQAAGQVWTVTEADGGCHSTWTQQGATNTFDYKASDCGNVEATITVTIVGQVVTAARSNSSDGNNCSYSGTLSTDSLSATGLQNCPQQPGKNFKWSATISGALPPAAVTLRVWTLNDAFTVNPPWYRIGDDITVCFSTPSFGAAVLTGLPSDGSDQYDYYDYGGDATSTCLDKGVAPIANNGPGQECMRLDFTPVQGGVSGATQTTQVCWQDLP